jgi:hypothetical protein
VSMSVFFSINHACVVSVLNVSVQLLGNAGSYQSGGWPRSCRTSAAPCRERSPHPNA